MWAGSLAPGRARKEAPLALLVLAGCCLARPPPPAAGPACRIEREAVACPSRPLAVALGDGSARTVHLALPVGEPPAAGWPVVLLFQGSFFPAGSFAASRGEAFGGYYQALAAARLLAAGYAVLAPETHGGGATFWDTNVPLWAHAWAGSPDDRFMQALLAALERGALGRLDARRLYAAGISSGGYMASRMAVSYPGRFKALAIQSASYATCSGPVCNVPGHLPEDHPPTLFLHGGADLVVPPSTMQPYLEALLRSGHRAKAIVDPAVGHAWLPAAPEAIVAWFDGAP